MSPRTCEKSHRILAQHPGLARRVPDVLTLQEGVLITPDDTRGLADTLVRILNPPEIASRRAKCARARLDRKHLIKSWLDRNEEICQAVVASHRVA